jgi:hypothetical protein
MESVYAGTSTVAEIPFTTLLEPGDYSVVLSLSDASQSVSATTPAMVLSVPISTAPVSANLSSIAQAAAVNQPVMSDDGSSTFRLAVTAAGLLALALALGAFALVKRLKARTAKLQVDTPAIAISPTPASPLARPVSIRQLDVPRRPCAEPSVEQPQHAEPRFRKLSASGTTSRFTTISNNTNGA